MKIIYMGSFPTYLKIHQEIMELCKLYLRTCLLYVIEIRGVFSVRHPKEMKLPE